MLGSTLFSMNSDKLDLSRVLSEIRKVQASTGAFQEVATQVEKEFREIVVQTDVRFLSGNNDTLDQIVFDQETKIQEISRHLDVLENKYSLEKEKSEKNNPIQQERIFNFLVEKYTYGILEFRYEISQNCFVYGWDYSASQDSDTSIRKCQRFITKPQIEQLFGKSFSKNWHFPVREELDNLQSYHPTQTIKGTAYKKEGKDLNGFYFGFSHKGDVGLKIMDWIDKATLSMSPSQAENFINENLEKLKLSICEAADKNLKSFSLYDTCVVKNGLDVKNSHHSNTYYNSNQGYNQNQTIPNKWYEYNKIREQGNLEEADKFFRANLPDFATFKQEYLKHD